MDERKRDGWMDGGEGSSYGCWRREVWMDGWMEVSIWMDDRLIAR